MRLRTLAVLTMAGIPAMLLAQGPPLMPPPQLEQLVARIALYPDPLLAQILAAATYPEQIQDADMWANQHKYLRGDEVARAINEDRLPFDPSVQSLLPFPQVLHMMAGDPGWTRQVGDAFLSQRGDVMDAVQRDRRHAYDYGYLRGNPHFGVVLEGPQIIINPIGSMYYVPIYNPGVVYYAPRPGFLVGGAITFGAGFALGAAFAPWGWGGSRFDWGHRTVILNNHEWGRTYVNRGAYAHPYVGVQRYQPAVRAEGHRLEPHEAHHEERGRDDRRK